MDTDQFEHMGKYDIDVKKDTRSICGNVGRGSPSPLIPSSLK